MFGQYIRILYIDTSWLETLMPKLWQPVQPHMLDDDGATKTSRAKRVEVDHVGDRPRL